jgi:hypothetical protein
MKYSPGTSNFEKHLDQLLLAMTCSVYAFVLGGAIVAAALLGVIFTILRHIHW